MSIFRRHGSAPDLSDQALNQSGADSPAMDAESPAPGAVAPESAPGVEADPGGKADPGSLAPSDSMDAGRTAAPSPEQEQRWQEAAHSVAGHWPQIKDDLPGLLTRMKAISERYGDPGLWQRSPAGIMREAAVELYGMPSRPDAGALSQAVQAAHEQGRRTAADRRRALAGLAPPQVSRTAPPPLSEEEKILQDMRRARKGRLF